ncbi:MAG: hypothetical protein LBS21_01980 [Clostridiales bacterium]|nr:hypothetical protein [Clostridiales bacterium]
MKKISDLLFKNIFWKLLCVLLAALLWLVCINVVNPIVTRSFSNPLTIKNLDIVESNGYILLNREELENQLISVSVRGVNNSFSQVSANAFAPYIDVSPIDYLHQTNIGTNQPLIVHVDRIGASAMSNFSADSIQTNPLTVNIRLDKITQVSKPVTVNITGDEMESYVALPGHTEPETITITGPSTVLNRISTVSVEVDVTGASQDVSVKLVPQIIDVDKRDITSQVELSEEFVEIRIPVNMYAKIPIQQNYTGSVAEGYAVTSISKSIDFVEVVGTKEDIAKLEQIVLPDLNLSGWTATDSRSFDVRPELIDTSLSVVNGTPNEVVITVNIEKQIEKEITLNAEDIRIIGMSGSEWEFTIPGGEISFVVKGLAEKINAFNASQVLDASANVSALEPGTHQVNVSVLLPQGITLGGEQPVIEVIVAEAGADTDTDTDTEADSESDGAGEEVGQPGEDADGETEQPGEDGEAE